ARRANDVLYAATRAYPTRFAGFAELPTVDPKAAADELERTVAQYNFKGALINGLTAGAFLDDKRFWCIFERAQALDVPIYLHPGIPHQPSLTPITPTTAAAIFRFCRWRGASLLRPPSMPSVWLSAVYLTPFHG